MNGARPGNVMIGVLLLALFAGTTGVPGAVQPPADAPPGKPAAANVQVLPAAPAPGPMDDGVVRVPLIAVNQGSERARFWFRPVMFDSSGQPVELEVTGMWRDSTKDWIQAGEIVPFMLTLRSSQRPFGTWWDKRLPLKGHLAIVTTSESTPTIKSQKTEMRELSVPQIQPAALEIIGVIAAASGSVLVVLLALGFRAGAAPEGPASWSSDSIGANVALAAGLASGLAGVAGLPQLTVYASRPTYGLLIVIFAAVVALASPVANLLGKILPASVSFFAAATFVLWGAVGQFMVALFLVLELRHASVIADSTAWTLGILDVALGLAVVGYVFYVVARPQTRKVENPAQMRGQPPPEGSKEWAIP